MTPEERNTFINHEKKERDWQRMHEEHNKRDFNALAGRISNIPKDVEAAVKVTVNGKLDAQNVVMDNFIKEMRENWRRTEPVIIKFEESQTFNEEVTKLGNKALYWAKIIGALGVIALTVKFGILQLITTK